MRLVVIIEDIAKIHANEQELCSVKALSTTVSIANTQPVGNQEER
jgi:hypothetical protein